VGRDGRGVLNDPGELRALLLLRLLPGVGDRRTAALLRAWGSAGAALAAPRDDFARLAGRAGEGARRDPGLHRRIDEVLDLCRSLEVRIVPLNDPLYPEALHHLVDPPPVLFLRGDPALLRIPSVTIVGARKATPTGRRVAEGLAAGISERGIPVVSGLALGIDAAAHRGAVDGAGGTVAVLGCGPDRVHPPGNRRLFNRIVERGLVVTEFLPGEAALRHNFPRRNRILAALSDTVVVVEAGERSGALITVDHALDLGREVYAVPGSVEAPQSMGSNRLLLDGARPVTRLRDLEPALRWGWRKWAAEPGRLDPGWAGDEGPGLRGEPLPGSAATDPRDPVRLLGPAPRSLERLVAGSGLPPGKLLALLTELELRGVARREGEGWCLNGPGMEREGPARVPGSVGSRAPRRR
jgi:DNA processing protein